MLFADSRIGAHRQRRWFCAGFGRAGGSPHLASGVYDFMDSFTYFVISPPLRCRNRWTVNQSRANRL